MFSNTLKVSLNMSANSLDRIPDSITNCSALRSLTLTRNKIRCLPDDIGDLFSLEILDVADNNIEAFPEILPYCRLLCELNPLLQEIPFSGNEIFQPLPLKELAARRKAQNILSHC